MRFLILAALLAAVTAHSAAQELAPPPRSKEGTSATTDLDLLQGIWSVVGLETGGKAEQKRNYQWSTFTFARRRGTDTATLREGKLDPIEFRFKLDPTLNPKNIDLELAARKVTFRGIYKLDGDELVICISIGGPRPTRFTTKDRPDTEMFSLKRNRWEPFADQIGFRFEMPGKPEEHRRELETPAGKTTANLFVLESEMERVAYVLAVARLPNKLDGKDRAAARMAIRNVAVEAVYPRARIRQEERKAGPRMAGIESQELSFRIDLPDTREDDAARVRVLIVGDRLYALLVAGPEEGIKPESLNRFWNSFRPPVGRKGRNRP